MPQTVNRAIHNYSPRTHYYNRVQAKPPRNGDWPHFEIPVAIMRRKNGGWCPIFQAYTYSECAGRICEQVQNGIPCPMRESVTTAANVKYSENWPSYANIIVARDTEKGIVKWQNLITSPIAPSALSPQVEMPSGRANDRALAETIRWIVQCGGSGSGGGWRVGLKGRMEKSSSSCFSWECPFLHLCGCLRVREHRGKSLWTRV